MSLFSFGGLNPVSISSSPKSNIPGLSTSPSNKGSLTSPTAGSPSVSLPARNNQLSSPVCSPLLETNSLCENPDSNIFERSVQEAQVKNEDYIPPALDASAHILSEKGANLDEVEMIYSSRRSSSVIGLNMALGRPYTPLRKNSVYSMSQMNSFGNQGSINHNLSQSSLTHQPTSPISPPKLNSSKSSVSFYSYADMINNDEFARRPSMILSCSHGHGVSPTIGRKMSVASNHSTTSNTNLASPNNVPSLAFNKLSRKMTLNSMPSSLSQSQLSKQFSPRTSQPLSGIPLRKSSKRGDKDQKSNKFLISPESSDSEDQEVYYPATSISSGTNRKSILSNGGLDDDTLVSTSVGDCIRQCTTEIGGQ